MIDHPSTAAASRPRGNAIVVRIIILGVVLAFGTLALEAATRVVYDRNGMHYGIEMWKYAKLLKRQSPSWAIGHEHIPNSQAHLMGQDMKINSQGLRGPEIGAPRAGIRRVVVLGDSMTVGWGAKEDETYPRVLEKMLNANGQRAEVINAGVGNYNTSMEVAWFLERGQAMKPDDVILGYYINDAEETPRMVEGWLPRHSYLYVVLSSTWDAMERAWGWKPSYEQYYDDLYRDDNPGWRQTQKSLETLIQTCQKNGIGLRVLLIPELHQVEGEYPFRFVHDRVRAIAARHDVAVLDLDGAFRGHDPKTLWVSPGDAHPNGVAHRIIAEQLFAAMQTETE